MIEGNDGAADREKISQHVPDGFSPQELNVLAMTGADSVAAVRPMLSAKAAVIKKALKILIIVSLS